VKRFRLEVDGVHIHWDADYGCYHKRGWSLAKNGHFIVQLVGFRYMLAELVRRKR